MDKIINVGDRIHVGNEYWNIHSVNCQGSVNMFRSNTRVTIARRGKFRTLIFRRATITQMDAMVAFSEAF